MLTFCIPSKNNLRYLKPCIKSIQDNSYYPNQIIVYVDQDTDGTVEWLRENGVKFIQNHEETPRGIGFAYDNMFQWADREYVIAFHADMILGPHADKHMMDIKTPNNIVCATRIEPPLHPAGIEKIVQDFGVWPEDLKIEEFNRFVEENKSDRTTKSIFAPWLIRKDQHLGHDPIFRSVFEDADLFRRFKLQGYDLIQSWSAMVYHLTCRGHRWTEEIGKDDDYFKNASAKAARNYLRKWGSWIENDEYQRPILKPRYDIGIVVENCDANLLLSLEPWFNNIYVDQALIADYIEYEQPKTDLRLEARVRPIEEPKQNDIMIYFDAKDNVDLNIVPNIQVIIRESVDAPGTYEYEGLKIDVLQMVDHTDKMMGTFIKNVF